MADGRPLVKDVEPVLKMVDFTVYVAALKAVAACYWRQCDADAAPWAVSNV